MSEIKNYYYYYYISQYLFPKLNFYCISGASIDLLSNSIFDRRRNIQFNIMIPGVTDTMLSRLLFLMIFPYLC